MIHQKNIDILKVIIKKIKVIILTTNQIIIKEINIKKC
jgi:hypothetical protein